MALTPKQALFVREYLISLNAADAARRAGFSEKTARSQGYRLLREPDVADAIKVAREERETRLELSADLMLQRLKGIAFLDVGALYEWDGDKVWLKPSQILTDSERRSVAEVSVTTTVAGRTLKMRPHDALQAMRLIKELQGYGAAPGSDGEAEALKAIVNDEDPDILP